MSSLVPKHGQKCKDEVRLIQLHTLAVDANEYVRHVLLVDGRRNFQRPERILLEIEQVVQIVGDLLLLLV